MNASVISADTAEEIICVVGVAAPDLWGSITGSGLDGLPAGIIAE
jgi:hypothetical protein